MRTEADRWLGAVFHGWVELLTLSVMLLVGLAIVGWAWNRGFRPSDRGPLVSVPLLIAGLSLILLLRSFREHLIAALIIAIGLVLAGLLGRGTHPRGLWMPAMAFAALLGLGLNLSAVLLVAVIALALLFSARGQR